jgi:CRISPR-associated protein Csd1
MLLQRLADYAANQDDQLPKLHQLMPIRWLIDLDERGSFQGFSQTSGSTKKNDRGKLFVAPAVARTVGIKANLLADNAEYVLGIARDPEAKGADKVPLRHRAFRDLIGNCAAATSDPGIKAVLTFLENFDPTFYPLPEGFDAKDNLTFRVSGHFPIDVPAVQRYWGDINSENAPAKRNEPKQAMACIVCGQAKPIAERHPIKIKGIPDGQTSGMTLISANANAFESYGLESSLIAPTCLDCAEAYANGLNQLLKDEATHLRMGPLVYVFWTKGDAGFSLANLLREPQPDMVGALLQSVFSGQARAALDQTAFYATALSASGARVVVRDWLETTIGAVQTSIGRYFALQRLINPDGSEAKPIGLYALIASLYRDAGKDMQAGPLQELVHCALHGGPLPMSLLQRAVQRNRAEQQVTHPRAALIKMVLLSQSLTFDPKENTMVSLDPTCTDQAYLCGRLFAELEEAQRKAIPGLSATIVDRFYGTASTAPAAVFGYLLKGCHHHLAKLRKDPKTEGAYYGIQSRIESIQSQMTAFPRVLSLHDQAQFSLGYYHQRAANRSAAVEAKAKKAAAASTDA